MVTAVICAAIVAFTLWIKRGDWLMYLPDVVVVKQNNGQVAQEQTTTPTTKPKVSVKARHPIVWGITFIIALILMTWVGWSFGKHVSSGSPGLSQTDPTPTASAPVFPTISQKNLAAVKTDKYFREKIPSEVDAARMLWTINEESSFRQFDTDGSVLKSKTGDIGMTQINEADYLEKSKELGYDIYTLDGNLDMALWIYQHDGLTKWVTHEKAVMLAQGQGDYTVLAPVGSWVRIPTLHGEILRYHGPVLRRDDKGNVAERDDVATNPTMSPVLETAWIEVQSRISEPVKVTVSR